MEPRSPIARTIEPTDKEELQALLLRLRTHGQQLLGRVHLLNLRRIRKHFGARWAHMSERVHNGCVSTLKTHAFNSYVFYPYDADTYLIFSYLGSTRKVRQNILNISEEILAKLLGSEAPAHLIDLRALSARNGEAPSFAPVDATSRAFAPQEHAALGLIYRPLLAVQKSFISAYVCLPIRKTGIIECCSGYDVLQSPDNPNAIAKLDTLVLNRVAEECTTQRGDTHSCRAIIPVHFASLCAPDACATYVKHVRKAFGDGKQTLGFELVGLPNRLTEFNFTPLVEQLRAITPWIGARVGLGHRNFIDLRVAGLRCVAADLYNDFRSEPQILNLLEHFNANAHDEGLLTSISGIRTTSLNTAAINTGSDYVSGAFVAKNTSTMQGPQHYDLVACYSQADNAA